MVIDRGGVAVGPGVNRMGGEKKQGSGGMGESMRKRARSCNANQLGDKLMDGSH